MSRAKFTRILTWAAALALLGWVLSQFELGDLSEIILSLRPQGWVVWLVLNALVILLLAGRWLVLSRALGLSVSLPALMRFRQAGQLISFVTPGPQFGGEPLQVFWLVKRQAASIRQGLLSVAMDRLFELWINFSVLAIAVLALAGTSLAGAAEWHSLIAALLLALAVISVGAWLLLYQPEFMQNWISTLGQRWQPPGMQNLKQAWSGSRDLLRRTVAEKKGSLSVAVLLSLLGWAAMLGEFLFVLWLSQISVTLPSFLLFFVAVRLAFLLPLPGGLGSVEAAVLWSTEILGASSASAAYLIGLMRFRDLIVLLVGAVCLPGLARRPQASAD